MKKTTTILTLLICFIANSQCIKGDCDNGIGTKEYDLRDGTKGTYVGQFKDRYPDGKGKYTYENFSNNFKPVFEGFFTQEGEEIIQIDNTREGKLTYPNGGYIKGFITKIKENNSIRWELNGDGEMKTITDNGDYIEKGNFIDNILDDENGEIKYPSGNVYIGGVVNGKRQGLGKIITPEGGIQKDGNWFDDEWIDANKNNPYAVPIFYQNGSIYVEVDFSGTKFPMVLDSGASTVVINKNIFLALVTLGQIKIKSERDNSFQIANGDIVTGATYLIEKMKIGSHEINDIECSVLDNLNAANLLGLNALLAPTNYFSINIEAGELNF